MNANVPAARTVRMGGATPVFARLRAFGVVGFSESVALELHGSRIAISVVGPAIIRSQMSAGLKEIRGARVVEPAEVAEAIIGRVSRSAGHRAR